jgi:sphingosine kinase
MDLINAMDDGEKGASFWFPNVSSSVARRRTQLTWPHQLRYYKAHAYRITPASPDADVRLSVDGEAYPFGEFQVEVHPGLGRVLSPEGQYAARFSIPPPHDFNDATNQT